MRYSNALEITAMTLMWAAVLIWYDVVFSQRIFDPTRAQIQSLTPQVSLWIQHVGCSGKSEAVLQALRAIAWLGKPELKHAQEMPGADAEGHARPEAQCDIGVLANVLHVQQADFQHVDFMAIYDALRPLDVVPTTVEFGGIPHFALQAKVPSLRCDACDQASMQALQRSAASVLSRRKDPKLGETFKWLDSQQTDLKNQTITAFVRFNNGAHVHEMVWALTQAGLPPASIHVVFEQVREELHRKKKDAPV